MNFALLEKMNAELAAGRPLVMISLVATSGSTPRKAGSRMLLFENGRIAGSVGGGLIEGRALDLARAAFKDKKSRLAQQAMTSDVAAAEGMACGGEAEFFVQYVAPDSLYGPGG